MFKYLLALLIISSANVFACQKCDSYINNLDKNLKLMKIRFDSYKEKGFNIENSIDFVDPDYEIMNYVGLTYFVLGADIAYAKTKKNHEVLVENLKNNLKNAIHKNALVVTKIKSLDEMEDPLADLNENYMKLMGINAMEAIIKKNHP